MGRIDCGGHGCGGAERFERALPPTEQAVAEVREDVVRELPRTGGALLDRLHPSHKLLSAPESDGMGHTAQQRPLLCTGLPPRHRASRTITISEETYTFTHQASRDPRRGGPPVC